MNKTKLLLLLILFIFNFTKNVKAQVSKQDSLVLVDFYHNLNGTKWTIKRNWLTSEPVSTWYGITVTNNRVTQINFAGNNMNGVLTESLGNLDNLEKLYLFSDSLKGSIPSSLGNLKNLNVLMLGDNQLTGTIPSSLGNLSNLQALFLFQNNLTGAIPPSLGNLNALYQLNLENNKLTDTIPSSLGNLKNLRFFYLYSNQLTGTIPASLGNLYNVQYFDLSRNKLTGTIPYSFSNLKNLREAYFGNNFLKDTIQSFWADMPTLYNLDLSSNQLSGTIPLSFGQSKSLYDLYLDHNQLTGEIPDTLHNLHFGYLYLDHNNLTGKIPSWLGDGKVSFALSLGNNNFKDSIPSSLGNVSQTFFILDLDSAGLSGTIPSTLNNIKYYKYLIFTLAGNKFTFNGMEQLANTFSDIPTFIYSPQDTILLHYNNNILSVSAGGTLSNNTYTWFRNSRKLKAIKGDSTFTITQNGTYRVEVTNSIANKLTLYSNQINSNVLATTLPSFSATKNQNSVILNWQVVDEKNINYFNVQRSADGVNFNIVNKVVAVNNSSSGKYQYTDINALSDAGILYYRIELIDNDGSSIISNIQTIKNSNNNKLFSVSPNPAKDFIAITSYKNVMNAEISLIDISGKTLYTTKQNLNAGQPFKISLFQVHSDILIIKIVSDKNKSEFKIIKQ